MYERMLEQSPAPSYEDMLQYVGERGSLLVEFDRLLGRICPVQTAIRFPYGKHYGWSVRYGQQGKANKHICDAFAEAEAFTVHFHISNTQLDQAYPKLSEDSKRICDHKYPCGDGGWIHYRVLSEEGLADVLILLSAKLGKQKAVSS